mmetsp:Transcript_16275/g.42226  ORF Transcript_16275/g.42226 Transcript_16275/m.42226 type:complete len:349 (+) Transcript_16275:363-1409(+)
MYPSDRTVLSLRGCLSTHLHRRHYAQLQLLSHHNVMPPQEEIPALRIASNGGGALHYSHDHGRTSNAPAQNSGPVGNSPDGASKTMAPLSLSEKDVRGASGPEGPPKLPGTRGDSGVLRTSSDRDYAHIFGTFDGGTRDTATTTSLLLHECDFCEYATKRKDNLIRHRRTHTGERPFVCNQCGYATTHKGHLTQHLRKHSGEKPFQCTRCDYRAAKRWDVTVHMRMHTGEKPYACRFCTYRAAYKCDLTAHLRTHTGEKPYACQLCDYRATQKAHMTRHLRKHTGERPFPCTQCSYRCANRSDLKKHLEAHKRGTTRDDVKRSNEINGTKKLYTKLGSTLAVSSEWYF